MTISHECCLSAFLSAAVRCSVAENDWDLWYFLTRTVNATSVKSHASKWPSVGIETLLKAILEPDRSSAFKDHFTQQKRSVPSQQKSKSDYLTQHPENYEGVNVFMKGIVTHSHRDHVPAMLLGDSRSRQACCQVPLSSEPPSLLSKPHPYP